MGRRKEDGTWEDSCLEKLKPGEPFFVLRAQDLLAPEIVREWATRAHTAGTPREKVIEAFETSKRMEEWAAANGGKVPD